ncbi:MAG: hypothetical protein U0573_08225 [Phycisphaerales bacterium]|nr:hypothetical protein [Planctomycetota bacterium]
MTYGGYFGKKAKGAINRFYEHAETRHIASLQEAASELFLATTDKSREKLWAKVDLALGHLIQDKFPINAAKARSVLEARNIQQLAALVGELAAVRK